MPLYTVCSWTVIDTLMPVCRLLHVIDLDNSLISLSGDDVTDIRHDQNG